MHSAIRAVLLLAWFSSPVAFAQLATNAQCPNASKLRNICMSIDRRSEWEDAPPRYRFLYQQKILEASCVDAERDAPEVVSTKVRAMWASLSDRLICNNVQFDVTDGSVLKYAVTSHFDAFLYDVRRWGVPLNKVDTSDGRTLLDYVTFQEQRNAGTAIAQKMRFYYNFLRDAGAKHASELK